MNYDEFVKAVAAALEEEMHDNISIGINEVLHNNGRMHKGISVHRKGYYAAPTVYLEAYYAEYLSGKSTEEIVMEIQELLCELDWSPKVDPEWIRDYQSAKWRLIPRLISREKNRELLGNMPYRSWMDLAVIFCLLLRTDEKTSMTMTVQNSHMREWQVTENELYEMALSNARCLVPAKLVPISDVLFGAGERERNLLRETPAERERGKEEMEKNETMYVLTNEMQNYGASCLLYPRVKEEIAEILGENYWVIPSSIHEMLIVPECMGAGSRELQQMIREVNETQVLPEEVLGSHAYFYLSEKGLLSM